MCFGQTDELGASNEAWWGASMAGCYWKKHGACAPDTKTADSQAEKPN